MCAHLDVIKPAVTGYRAQWALRRGREDHEDLAGEVRHNGDWREHG